MRDELVAIAGVMTGAAAIVGCLWLFLHFAPLPVTVIEASQAEAADRMRCYRPATLAYVSNCYNVTRPTPNYCPYP